MRALTICQPYAELILVAAGLLEAMQARKEKPA